MMVQFPQQVQCDRLLDTQQFNSQHNDALAAMVADLHQQTPIANKDDSYGELEQIFKPIKENVTLLKQLIQDKDALAQIENSAAVHSIERIANLSYQAQQPLLLLNYNNVDFYLGDGHQDWIAHAPYDAILVTAAATSVPPKLIEQLKTDGNMGNPRRFKLYASITSRYF